MVAESTDTVEHRPSPLVALAEKMLEHHPAAHAVLVDYLVEQLGEDYRDLPRTYERQVSYLMRAGAPSLPARRRLCFDLAERMLPAYHAAFGDDLATRALHAARASEPEEAADLAVVKALCERLADADVAGQPVVAASVVLIASGAHQWYGPDYGRGHALPDVSWRAARWLGWEEVLRMHLAAIADEAGI